MKFTRSFILFLVLTAIVDVAVSKKSYFKKKLTNKAPESSKSKSTELESIPEILDEDNFYIPPIKSKYSSSLETIKEEDKFQGNDIEKLIFPPIGAIFEEDDESDDDNDDTEGSVADNEDLSDIESDSDDNNENEIDNDDGEEKDEHVSSFHNRMRYYENYHNIKPINKNEKESSNINKSKNVQVPSYKTKKHYPGPQSHKHYQKKSNEIKKNKIHRVNTL